MDKIINLFLNELTKRPDWDDFVSQSADETSIFSIVKQELREAIADAKKEFRLKFRDKDIIDEFFTQLDSSNHRYYVRLSSRIFEEFGGGVKVSELLGPVSYYFKRAAYEERVENAFISFKGHIALAVFKRPVFSNYAKFRKHNELDYIVRRLGLVSKEGLSIEDYVNSLSEVGYEDGPVRSCTLYLRHRELLKCTWLYEFVNSVVANRDTVSEFCFELGEDLESSVYLAISGHYRQACAILRFACENALLDSYFELSEGYEEWKKGEFFVPSGKRLIDKVFSSEYAMNALLKKHISKLSGFVHMKSEYHTNPNVTISYSPESFDEWVNLFTDSCVLIVKTLLAYRNSKGCEWHLFKSATGESEETLIFNIWI